MLKVNIILGSTRPNRAGEGVTRWFQGIAAKHTEIEFELIDLRDYPLPFYNEVAPMGALNGQYSEEIITKWVAKVKDADAYIVITPEYNHGYPAVLKNALDYAYAEWNKKPIAFVSYGSFAGGARSVEQLRQVAVELQMAPTRNAIHIIKVWEHSGENGEMKNMEGYEKQAEAIINDIFWWGNALKKAREEGAKE